MHRIFKTVWKAEGYLHTIPKNKLPFRTVHVDHVGPLEKTVKGFKYLFVIIDASTKFIKIYHCKTTASDECIKHLQAYFRSYSKSKRIISDRDSAFTSMNFKEFIKDSLIEHILVAVGTPRANGQVERYNEIIMPIISKLCKSLNKWDQVTDEVEFSLNNTVCKTARETPSRFLFGGEQKGKMNDCVREILEERMVYERDLSEMRENASKKIEKNQMMNKQNYDKKRKGVHPYEVDDYVMIRNIDTTPGVSKKLIPKFKGPYQITKILDKDRYIVKDVDNFQVTQRQYEGVIAPDNMKPCIA